MEGLVQWGISVRSGKVVAQEYFKIIAVLNCVLDFDVSFGLGLDNLIVMNWPYVLYFTFSCNNYFISLLESLKVLYQLNHIKVFDTDSGYTIKLDKY